MKNSKPGRDVLQPGAGSGQTRKDPLVWDCLCSGQSERERVQGVERGQPRKPDERAKSNRKEKNGRVKKKKRRRRRKGGRDAPSEAQISLGGGDSRQFRAFRGNLTRKLETYTSGPFGFWIVGRDRPKERKINKRERERERRDSTSKPGTTN